MARKLNKNVVGILTLLGMALLAVGGIVLLRNMPGQDPKVYAAEAKRLEDQQKYNEAMQTYYRAYTKDPGHNPEHLVDSARCAREDGDIAAARMFIQQARVKNAKLRSAAELSTELEFELANVFGGALQWNTVLEEAKKLAEIEDQSPLVQKAMGSAYAKLADQDETYAEKGEAALKRAWELDPTNADVVKSLAEIRWAQAQKKLREKKPKEADALIEDIRSNLKSAAEKCEEQGNEKAANDLKRTQALFDLDGDSPKDGLAALEKLVADEKTDVDSHLRLASVYSEGLADKLPRDLDKAEKLLKEAMEIDPKNGEAYYALGHVYQMQRALAKDPAEQQAKLAREEEVYKRGLDAIERTKHFRLRKNNLYREDFISKLCLQDVQRAREASSPEQKAEALKSAEAWVEKLKQEVDLESTPVRLLTAHILNARGEYVAAIREAEAAERSMKGQRDFQLLVLLGDLYATQRQWGAAKEEYQAALEEDQRRGGITPAVWLALADCYLRMDQPAEALNYLKPMQVRALQDFMEKNEMAIRLRMEAYRQLGRLDQVAKEGEKLAQSAGGDEMQQARILAFSERYDEAEGKLKAVLEKKADDPEAVRLLFRVYISAGRTADAQAFAKSLRQRDPTNRDYERMEFAVSLKAGELPDEKIVQFWKEEPDEFLRASWLADFYIRRKQYEEAGKYADQAEQLRPEDGTAVDRQFRLAIMAKDWDRAEKYAAKTGTLNFDGTEGKLSQG
ncbi:MAG TPA: tetratricopeptide repeat protein, partial [Phycisphaerae bacterium]|nr:tetratricopeptide repeat protein [Phycisphaerae bacterium]